MGSGWDPGGGGGRPGVGGGSDRPRGGGELRSAEQDGVRTHRGHERKSTRDRGPVFRGRPIQNSTRLRRRWSPSRAISNSKFRNDEIAVIAIAMEAVRAGISYSAFGASAHGNWVRPPVVTSVHMST